jgi:hypothetical protein
MTTNAMLNVTCNTLLKVPPGRDYSRNQRFRKYESAK